MTSWRYLVQRPLSKQWLHTDLPLSRDALRWDLSAAGALRGSLAPEVGGMLAEDDRPLLDEWGTFIYAEADGIIRWGGLVISSKFIGSSWYVEAAGFTTYPFGIPYTAPEYLRGPIDPAQIIRDIWAHVQSHPDGDLGVSVIGSTTARRGTTSTAALRAAQATWEAAKTVYDAENAKLKTLRDAESAARKVYSTRVADRTAKSKALAAAKKTGNAGQIATAQSAYNAAVAAATAQKTVVDQANARTEAQATIVEGKKAVLDKAADARDKARDQEQEDGGAYLLQWWETPDCGLEIDTLAQETPLDFIESHQWNEDRTDITHTVNVHYPRAGRKRTDLSFTLGENVTAIGDPQRDGDRFANEIIGLGAGEGAGSLRRTTAVRDGRLRRPHVYLAKTVAKKDRLDALIRDERIRRQQPLTIPTITVKDHPHAPIASWQLGDDILVQATLPWLGDVSIWHRVVGWELVTEHTATLSLARSDSFTYGA